MTRRSTKVGMFFVYIIIAVIVLVPIATYLIVDNPAQAKEKAQKTCALAAVGMHYADFETAIAKLDVKPKSVQTKENQSAYHFIFLNDHLSGNFCKIRTKDGIIISKQSD